MKWMKGADEDTKIHDDVYSKSINFFGEVPGKVSADIVEYSGRCHYTITLTITGKNTQYTSDSTTLMRDTIKGTYKEVLEKVKNIIDKGWN